MTQRLNHFIFNTEAGWLGLLGSSEGLRLVVLPQNSEQKARESLGDYVKQADWSSEPFRDLAERLQAYFKGEKVNFPDRLDLSGATEFQRRVWEATRHIPYGETRSYAWVARQIEKPAASRATGQALGRNPLPLIIPCHRVLASDGSLGGFTGGLDMKRYLLKLETSANNL